VTHQHPTSKPLPPRDLDSQRFGRPWLTWLVSCAALVLGGCAGRDPLDDNDTHDVGAVAEALVRALPARIEAEAFERFADSSTVHEGNCGSGPVDQETTSDPNGGTCNVGWTVAGEFLEYDLSSAAARTYNLTLRVASANAGKTASVQLDGVTVGSVTAPSAGWQSFADRTVSAVNVGAGNHVLRVTFVTGDVNLNYIDIAASGTICGDAACNGTETCSSCPADCGSCASGRSIAGNLEAEANDGMLGLQYETTTDTGGGQNAGYVDPGDYVEWGINVPTAGNYTVTLRNAVNTVTTAGAEILVNGVSRATLSMPATNGWQNWQSTSSSAFAMSAGFNTLRVRFVTAGQNLNWLKVTAAGGISSGDAYALAGSNACTWTLGTAAVEKTLTFAANAGTFVLSSFKNKLPTTAREYIQGGVASDEFRALWDGVAISGSSGGFGCSAGSAQLVNIGGVDCVQVNVTLSRNKLSLDKHYLVYPSQGLIREWTEYTNTDSAAHTLANPSSFQANVMSADVANVDLNYMSGADHTVIPHGGWTLKTTALQSGYARTFDSYDQFGCTGPTCNQQPYSETSQNYIPWFSLWNRANKDGLYFGFDYYGRWQVPVGAQNGKSIGFGLQLPTFSKSLNAAETIVGPKAFTGVYQGDLDDMTNRLLDWQYRYLWDYTRAPYFTAIRMLGQWYAGSSWGGTLDQPGLLQKVFGLADHLRTIGADTYHRDNGWWDTAGDWNGPDWKISHDYLAKMGMNQLIYYFPYAANTNSQTYQAHPSWFTNPALCMGGLYAERMADLSIPAAEAWVRELLVSKAVAWGDYQWRNDACFITGTDGASQYAEDAAFRRIQKDFLDRRPGSAIQGVDTGGRDINYEFLRMASSFSLTDDSGFYEQYDASRVFPVDKLSGIPDQWDPGNCSAAFNALLMFNPDFTGDPTLRDPNGLECMRRLIDTYHYLAQQGVVGRWVRQYHPAATDDVRNWFERLSQDGQRGLVIYKGPATSTSTRVYPKGLLASANYDVRYQFAAGSAVRTGADLMTNGITLAGVAPGELVYLGLPNHPGSGTDLTAPGAPSALSVKTGVNMGFPGVEIAWQPATDNVWVSHYEVFREGVSLGKVAKGTYFFDHSPAADPNARYGVRAVDGNGNVSATVNASGSGASVTVVDDSPAQGITYSSGWNQDLGTFPDVFKQSISYSDQTGAFAERTFVGSQVTWYSKWGNNCGIAQVYIDGALDAQVDTYAPDDNNWDLPSYTKAWPSVGTHTLRIQVSGTKNPLSSGNYVHIDGLQNLDVSPTVTENSNAAVVYGGAGWEQQTNTAASGSNLSANKTAGATAQFAFTGNDVSWIGRQGPDMGKADVYIDGVFDARIDGYGNRGGSVWQTAVYRKTWPVPGAHTLRIVVLGEKTAASTDSVVSIDAFHVRSGRQTVLNDAALGFTGPWNLGTGDLSYVNQDSHYCNVSGCRMSMTFSGTAVQLLGDKDTNHGLALITLDGVPQATIDAYGPGATGGRQPLWVRSDLANTSHILQVDVSGTHGSLANDSYLTIDGLSYWTPQ